MGRFIKHLVNKFTELSDADTFEYEPDYRDLREFIIELLCRDLKDVMGKMYSGFVQQVRRL